MKLYYYNAQENGFKRGNFGDDLNPWIWYQLIPELLADQQASTLFVSIGTLLNDFLPKDPQKVIFGAGAGYGSVNLKQGRFRVYFVRGRLTAKLLQIPEEKAITDPAILVKSLYKQAPMDKHYQYSYMPHHLESELNRRGWQNLCADCGLNYIDPGSTIEHILDEIAATEILLTEAMHGAIVADALRVPWVPIKANPKILEFKWHDWLDGLNLPYEPYRIHRMYQGIDKKLWPKFPKYFDYQAICFQLKRTIKTAQPSLSSEARSAALHDQVCVELDQLKRDYAAGLLR